MFRNTNEIMCLIQKNWRYAKQLFTHILLLKIKHFEQKKEVWRLKSLIILAVALRATRLIVY